jgi:hypothetical protein
MTVTYIIFQFAPLAHTGTTAQEHVITDTASITAIATVIT